MLTPATTVILILLLGLAGCQHPNTIVKSETIQKPLDDQADEIMIQHLLRRAEAAEGEIPKLRGEMLKHDNRCLEEQIAVLEGHPIKSPRQDPVAASRAMAKELEASLSVSIQGLLDGEAAIEAHNARHPESPWGDLKVLLRQMCGDCVAERTAWNSKLAEEAEKYKSTEKKPSKTQ
jgi:hypothetical protein